MNRFAILPLLTVLVTACDDRQPTAPSLPPRSPVSVLVTGLVTDERDAPIVAATVTVTGAGGPITVLTDASGRYDLTVPRFKGEIAARKTGFERNIQWLRASGDTSRDFKLRDIVTLTAGDSFEVMLTADDSLYGLELEYRSRPIRVRAHRAGTLELEAVPAEAQSRGRIAIDAFFSYPCCPSRLSLNVAGETEFLVNVLDSDGASTIPERVKLRTSLEPR